MLGMWILMVLVALTQVQERTGQIIGHTMTSYGGTSTRTLSGQAMKLNPASVYFVKQNEFYISHASWFVNIIVNFQDYRTVLDEADRVTSHFHETIDSLFSDVTPGSNGTYEGLTAQDLYEYKAMRLYALWAEDQVDRLKSRLETLYELRLMDPEWQHGGPVVLRPLQQPVVDTLNEQTSSSDNTDNNTKKTRTDRSVRVDRTQVGQTTTTSNGFSRGPNNEHSLSRTDQSVSTDRTEKFLEIDNSTDRSVESDQTILKNKYFETVEHFSKNISKTRHTRSVVPFLGDIVTTILGISTQHSISKLNKKLNAEIANNRQLRAILGNTVNVLNTTRMEVSENRERIRQLISKVAIQDQYFDEIRAEINHNILVQRINQRVAVSKLIDAMLWDVHRQVSKLEVLVNTVMSGKVTPYVISPLELKGLLANVTAGLPAGMFLPYDLGRELLSVYRSLTVVTLPHSDGILILCQLPILNSKNKYELYEVINLPVHFTGTNLTGQFNLEHKTFAISKDYTWVTFPGEIDYYECLRPHVKYCTMHAPQYKTAEYTKDCLMSLFLTRQNSQAHCPIQLFESSKPVSVRYLYNGTWAVSVSEQLVLRVLCDNGYEHNLVLKPNVHVFRLDKGCEAVSQKFRLGKFLYGDTSYKLSDTPAIITQNQTVWEILARPVHRAMLNIPKKLPIVALQSSSASDLLAAIQQELRVASIDGSRDLKGRRWTTPLIVAVVSLCLGVLTLAGVAIYLYLYRRHLLVGLLHSVRKLKGKQPELNMAYNNAPGGSTVKLVVP